jgi:Glycosyltransferase family 87
MKSTCGGWQFSRCEGRWLLAGALGLVIFGAILEKRTALRHQPMTDLGCFACASWAVWHGGDLYSATDWHGWHCQYPPGLAILFGPLAHPLPEPLPSLAPGERRTNANTPWGYGVQGGNFYGLHRDNFRFFVIVAVWYVVSVFFVLFSAHALACALEGNRLRDEPPANPFSRWRWWALRLIPLVVCIGSIGTDWSRGQVDVLMLAAISFGLYLAASQRDFISGFCLSFPATVKLFPALVLLYPLWRRRWRMSAGVFAGLVFFLVLLPAAVLGPRKTIEVYQTLSRVLVKPALGHGDDKTRSNELTAMNNTDNQSLLAGIHNWTHHDLPRRKRPEDASPLARRAVYAIGLVLLAGVVWAMRLRRSDSPLDLLLSTGLLLGASLVISPVAHNYYYLLMLPLIAALVDYGMPTNPDGAWQRRVMVPVAVFMMIDFVARLPVAGNILRDWAAPLLSLILIMATGAVVLLRPQPKRIEGGSGRVN